MVAIGVIPARFGSTRFPGKPLKLIRGKPLLQWVIEGARSSKLLSQVIVATDDLRIADLARQNEAIAVMTDSSLPSGTDRTWAAIRDQEADVVLNIQGDEPLLKGEILDTLIEVFSDASINMATLGRPAEIEALNSSTTAKILLNKSDEAIYFSRFPIPYSRLDAMQDKDLKGCLIHLGLYAYRKKFLQEFCAQGPVAIENFEGLEQLRALYLGAKIKVVRTNHVSWGVDTPEDVDRIEKMMAELERQKRN